jgi:hypothetical protein
MAYHQQQSTLQNLKPGIEKEHRELTKQSATHHRKQNNAL